MVPLYNAEAGVAMRRHDRLLAIIEARAPVGWWVVPVRLPRRLDENAPVGAFTALVERLLTQLPHTADGRACAHIELVGRVSDGELWIAAVPATGRGGLGFRCGRELHGRLEGAAFVARGRIDASGHRRAVCPRR